MSTHVLDLLLEISCRPLGCALKDHVLQEMSGAVGLVGLEPRSSVDPDSNGGSASSEVGLGGDSETVGQNRDAGFGCGEDLGMVT